MANSTEGNGKITEIKKCLDNTIKADDVSWGVLCRIRSWTQWSWWVPFHSPYSVILCFYIFQDYIDALNIIFTCLVSLNKWYKKLCIYISRHLWSWFWISERQIPSICLLKLKRSQATLSLTSSSSLRDVLVAIAEVIPAFRDWTSDYGGRRFVIHHRHLQVQWHFMPRDVTKGTLSCQTSNQQSTTFKMVS